MTHLPRPAGHLPLTLCIALLALIQPVHAVGVREAAVGLERQLTAGTTPSVTQSFKLPLVGSPVVLSGEARLETIDSKQCRRTLELVHDQPFERKGLRITNLSRRSVQDGPCQNFADAMAAQADASARNIAEQLGLAGRGSDSMPGQRVLVARAGGSTAHLNETSSPAVVTEQGSEVALLVREKAIIRDAPSRSGEKLSRADAGTHLKAWRIAGNSEWFALDGGLRFISASVVDASETTAAKAAPASTKPGNTKKNMPVRLKIVETAVLRNKPSFAGQKVASLKAGVVRLARKVPDIKGWFELTDSESRYPLYIHESVVSEKPSSDKRL
ncbi:MAG: hypothetical protein V4650_05690 [Pseudomonadota bacterium]